jgi:hypothetical protein
VKRTDKIKALTKFFDDGKPILKQETKVVFMLPDNGRLSKPNGMDAEQFRTYVTDLGSKNSNVMILE